MSRYWGKVGNVYTVATWRCHVTEGRWDMSILWLRKDVTLLREGGTCLYWGYVKMSRYWGKRGTCLYWRYAKMSRCWGKREIWPYRGHVKCLITEEKREHVYAEAIQRLFHFTEKEGFVSILLSCKDVTLQTEECTCLYWGHTKMTLHYWWKGDTPL
jgi:hypothetical protein